jgi:hypothetical protein
LGNTITGNNVANNTRGTELYSFGNDTIYHNSFINNTQMALVSWANSIIWDNGYPLGGNYWSDYNGTDLFYGLYQNRTGSDGIGDTPYTVDANNSDHYPLMKPWMPILPGDLNGDGRIDLKDLVILAFAYDSTPGCANWDNRADLNHDNRVSLTDLVTLATHYGEHNP